MTETTDIVEDIDEALAGADLAVIPEPRGWQLLLRENQSHWDNIATLALAELDERMWEPQDRELDQWDTRVLAALRDGYKAGLTKAVHALEKKDPDVWGKAYGKSKAFAYDYVGVVGGYSGPPKRPAPEPEPTPEEAIKAGWASGVQAAQTQPDRLSGFERGVPEVSLPVRCPRCGSPDPKKHPATQFEGEVQVCPNVFHGKDDTARIQAAVDQAAAAEAETPTTQWSLYGDRDHDLEAYPHLADLFREANSYAAR